MKKKIISWIKKQLRDSGAKGIVMGLSGGVDSLLWQPWQKKQWARREFWL